MANLHDIQQCFEFDNEFFDNILDLIQAHMYWKSKDGFYLGCNNRQAQAAGIFSSKDMIGKSDFDMPWKTSAEIIRKNDQEVIQKKLPKTFEESCTLADGKHAIFLSKKMPLKNKDKEAIGIFGISFDITDLYNEKEKLEITLNQIIAYMPNHVYWKSKDGVYLGCNDKQAKSLGFQIAEDVLGKTDFEISTPEEAQAFRDNDLKVMKTRKLTAVEEFAKVDGKNAIVLSQKVPLKDKNDTIIGILGVSVDITERKAHEKELKIILDELSKALKSEEKANKSKSLFLSIMSHELKNFIGNIYSATKIIQKKVLEKKIRNETIDKCLAICEKSTQEIQPFMDNVIDYFELDSQNIFSRQSPTNILDTIQAMISSIKPELNEKVKVLLDITASVPKDVLIDNLNLYKVFKIILSNAARFTQEGFINIKALIDNNQLVVEIKDTGQGIQAGQLKNIFNAFPEPGNENARYMKFGLKLSIAKKILDYIGGKIEITSEVNQGTTVVITLPCQLAASGDILETDLPTAQYEIKKILLVEDDVISLEMGKEILVSLGYQVETASCGLAAIEKATKNKFDLIFMDITLPDISGLEAAAEIHKKYNNTIPIVAVTSHSSEESIDDLLSKGMLSVIPKPISHDRFRQFFMDLPNMLADD